MSCARRSGQNLSELVGPAARQLRILEEATYNHPAVDADHEVEPGLYRQLQVGVAQHLEAQTLALLLVGLGLAIQAGYEAVQSVEHGQPLRRGPADMGLQLLFVHTGLDQEPWKCK